MLQGVGVERDEYPEDSDVAAAVNHHQLPDAFSLETRPAEERHVEQHREHELQRVDVEQEQEQQQAVERDRDEVLESETTVVLEVVEPQQKQKTEGHEKRRKLLEGVEQLVEVSGDLQADDQQRHRQREDGVGQPLDARDVATPPAEVAFGLQGA